MKPIFFIVVLMFWDTLSITQEYPHPFLDGDSPRATSSRVYKSQLILFARVSSRVADFNTRNQIITARLSASQTL